MNILSEHQPKRLVAQWLRVVTWPTPLGSLPTSPRSSDQKPGVLTCSLVMLFLNCLPANKNKQFIL